MGIVDLEARVLTAQRLESRRWVTIGTYGDETAARIAPVRRRPAQRGRLMATGASRRRNAVAGSQIGHRCRCARHA
jgi:hypothetical protein